MKQRQQHVTKPIIHEKGPMYLSVVQRPPGAPPGGGMALNEAGGTPPGWYGAAYATVWTGCCTTSPWTTGSFSASEGLSVPSGPVGHGGPGCRLVIRSSDSNMLAYIQHFCQCPHSAGLCDTTRPTKVMSVAWVSYHCVTQPNL